MDGTPLDRPARHAAQSGTSVRDHVVRTLVRVDFDERSTSSVDEVERFCAGESA
ncbi:ribbon-helix-helix protein, CopG family [Streptomyces macrosporus]